MNIKHVSVIGANGQMGAQSAAIIAGFGNVRVFMLARTLDKAKTGIEKAIASVRSNVLRKRLIPMTYEDLPKCLSKSDWVLEAVQESYEVKEKINKLISSVPRKGRIITTITSSLSVKKLSESLSVDDRKNYFGTHFFNPPYKMPLCELIKTNSSNSKIEKELITYLKKALRRMVVVSTDTPAFIANRIGFQFINEAARYADKYKKRGGILYIDTLLNRHTGRAMAPLMTIDFVGVDVHKAIIDNLRNNVNDFAKESFILPEYLTQLYKDGKLGRKSGEGLYKMAKDRTGKKTMLYYDIDSRLYVPVIKISIPLVAKMSNLIRNGNYRESVELLISSESNEASIIKHFIAQYIGYSLSLVGEVVSDIRQVDIAMAYGFNWAPPSAFVSYIGGQKKTARFLREQDVPVPDSLSNISGFLDPRPYFKS